MGYSYNARSKSSWKPIVSNQEINHQNTGVAFCNAAVHNTFNEFPFSKQKCKEYNGENNICNSLVASSKFFFGLFTFQPLTALIQNLFCDNFFRTNTYTDDTPFNYNRWAPHRCVHTAAQQNREVTEDVFQMLETNVSLFKRCVPS